ncbi:mavicyanin-like [Oryza brachyantha]|uniref:mavicyanin-like n=1 Tax=Oryza brachyantha TaxID=4533 RepID=UPI001ADA477F|nr:mavicyanin-like [Oryza brachyantha]
MGAARRRASAVAMAALAAAVMSAGLAAAAVYEVGDKAGWTIMGNPNYGSWAASKKFRLGDIVVFTYNKQFHNVMAVSKADYKNCDASKPIATWSTGNDSVVLNATGHHYFLCGFPGHCAIGQKVDVRVATSGRSSDAPSGAPSTAPAPASGSSESPAAAAPSPHGNAAAPAVGCCSVVTAIAVSVLSVAAAGLSLL